MLHVIFSLVFTGKLPSGIPGLESRKKSVAEKNLTLVGEDCLKFNEEKHRALYTGNFMCKYGLGLTSWKAALQKGTYGP